MKSPSSIFNFDTLHTRWKLPRAAALAVALVCLVEFGISRTDWVYRLYPNSYVGQFLQLEHKLESNGDKTQIIILGNSRTNGLLERRLERALDLHEGAVVNLATAGGDPFDWSLMFRRDRDNMRRARVIVLCLDNWQFDTNHLVANQRFRHYATVRDRWRVKRSWNVLLGGFCRTFEKQDLFRGVAKQLASSAMAPHNSQARWSRAPQTKTDVSDASTGKVADSAANVYKNFKLSTAQRDFYLVEILRSASKEGQRVIMLQVPLRDEFMKEVFAKYAADYASYKQFVSSVEGVPTVFFEGASTCGLEDSDFVDYGHLSNGGAVKFTHFFAEWLLRNEASLVANLKSR